MKYIVFLAPYPSKDTIKDGMMQRIAAIDNMFPTTNYKKIYIFPKYKSLVNKEIHIDNGTDCYYLSVWTGLHKIISLINNAAFVYCHALVGISPGGFFFWKKIKVSNVIWDVHGIVPEECKYAGQRSAGIRKVKGLILSKLFNKLERLVVYTVPKIVVVTDAMRNHLICKYPYCQAKFYTYPILPITIDTKQVADNKIDERQVVGINEEVIILYSGNIQQYQNIPLMIESIKRINKQAKTLPYQIRFEILTGQPDEMKRLFNQYGSGYEDNIHIHSVAPGDLSTYYSIAHYGYILRDDVDLNNVACPTKLVEYMAYGLTPIVFSSNIGDFKELGYQHIEVNGLDIHRLVAKKSKKNVEVYQKLVKKGDIKDFKRFIEFD